MKSSEQSARILPWPRRGGRERSDLEFLPAALEVIETPVSPVGRAIAGTIIFFLIIAIVWASFGRVDIVATATGKIVPTGRTKVIQPFETGVVRTIDVRDGQAVRQGDLLIGLDPTINEAEADRLRKELVASKLDVNRLRALLSDAPDPLAAFVTPQGATPAQAALHRTLLLHQVQEFRAKIDSLDHQVAQSEASRTEAEADVQKLALVIPLLQKRVAAFKKLVDDGWGEVLQYLQLSQDLVEHQQDFAAAKAKVTETSAGFAALQDQRRETDEEFRRTNYGDLSDAETKAAGLEEQLVQAEKRERLQTLTAPVDGTVQQLAVHTVGGVVTPAQQLMVLVPADSRLEIEAMVSNRDIGFVHEGQEAEVKVDTFNFTKYGLLRGTVESVSQDAIERNKSPDKPGSQQGGSEDKTSEPQGQELVYSARLSLDRTQMNIDGRLVNLEPGMAVTVEIKTGARRVIEYLLSPLLRYKQDALRER